MKAKPTVKPAMAKRAACSPAIMGLDFEIAAAAKAAAATGGVASASTAK